MSGKHLASSTSWVAHCTLCVYVLGKVDSVSGMYLAGSKLLMHIVHCVCVCVRASVCMYGCAYLILFGLYVCTFRCIHLSVCHYDPVLIHREG